jgi:dTDP-4-amino-4,6-dideoxygalactose transaminase
MYIMGKPEAEAVRKVIASGHLFRYRSGGVAEHTARFEKNFARRIGTKYALATTSGTASLICAMAGLGVGPGDEVIVPAYTFIATALAPLAVGAVPIIAEVDETLTLDPADLERKITRYTKAIIPVHMLGLPCDLRAILRIARRHTLLVIEDAAQACGGSYRGQPFGSLGHAGAFSFNHFKILSCGEGGAVVTSDKAVYQRAMICHDGGCVFFDMQAAAEKPPFFAGSNFRVSEIQSAMLNVQLRRLDGIVKTLRARKAPMAAILARARSFRLSPCNDPAGDCGTHLPLLFESEKAACAFVARHKQACYLFRPFDTGRHVYSNWEPILKQTMHHPKWNPWHMARRKIRQTVNGCPRTLDVLKRTVVISVPFDRTPPQVRALARQMIS